MKTPSCLLLITFLALPLFAAPQADPAKIFEHTGRDGIIYEWYLSPQQLRDSPRWDPYKGDPPLSVSNAVLIASQWIKTRWPNISRDRFLLRSIRIDSPRAAGGQFANCFYYTLMFRVGDFDSRACILLMDGTVLEPKAAGAFQGEAKPGTLEPEERPASKKAKEQG